MTQRTGEIQTPLTQRAYTLRLNRTPGNCARCGKLDCTCWREALWETHSAVNKGAKAFGDWLLTLRGGLDHRLADETGPSAQERKDRRVMLALSWLSVEDENGAPAGKGSRVATAEDAPSSREKAVTSALRDILRSRSVEEKEIDGWMADCGSSLAAAIREDAVWVNRSRAFDEACRQWKSLNREDARRLLEEFFGGVRDYLGLPSREGNDDEPAVSGGGQDVEFRNIARGWISFNFGTGAKSDTAGIAERLSKLAAMKLDRFAAKKGSELAAAMAEEIAAPAAGDLDGILDSIRSTVGWKSGRMSKGRLAIENTCRKTSLQQDDLKKLVGKLIDEAGKKAAPRRAPSWAGDFQQSIEKATGLKFSSGRDLTGEYSTMLDHAARRVSLAHSWIKLAEQRRRAMEDDAKKLKALSERAPQAKEWLDHFCAERSGASGANLEDGYRIRKRAVTGWERVIKAWARPSCKTAEERIEAAREVQADPDIEKFGDIQIFEALAVDDARCVWQNAEGEPDASILADYAAGTAAQRNQRRFKVPAYRHPDELRHPVFCDFGNSRWSIKFACHEAAKGARKLEDRHALRMGLRIGPKVDDVHLRWSSKRLAADLALNLPTEEKSSDVTRADRLGRAACGASAGVAVMNIFEEKDWNGRLQAPREQLDRVAALMSAGKQGQAEALRQRLGWLVSFSPRLRPSGPFLEYAAARSLWPSGKEILLAPKNDKSEWSGLSYPFWHPANEKGRKGHAKHLLSRLPGLRILSVDLGHRHAAAGAVWEAVPREQFAREKERAREQGATIRESEGYAHILWPERESNAATNKAKEEGRGKFRPLTVYRRIGADTLPNGSSHPAPWARLDRQFLIKLPGEDQPTRAAAIQELQKVAAFAEKLGSVADHDDNERPVDLLMSRAIRIAELGLKRHARRAKVAWALAPDTRSVFGMGGKETAFVPGDENHVKLLADALCDWHSLANDSRWDDRAARDLWNESVARMSGGWSIAGPQPQSEDPEAEEPTRQQRRKDEETLREKLEPIAKRLATDDRSALHRAWRARWEADDGAHAKTNAAGIATKPATGLHAELRWLSDWIMGKKSLSDEATAGWRQNVGGLSLTRIATMKSLYRLHKAFAMRARPEKPRGSPELGETNVGHAQSILDAMERLREQRVKQLASRIAEAALGIGSEERRHWEGGKRPRLRIADPRFAACHAVVIENLTHYRPEETRARRENRQLMDWASSKVKKYLSEACQLHGLHLREVQPGYTSRQDSRTGAPGIRCQDVPIQQFMRSPFWRKQVAHADKKRKENKGDARERFLCDLNAKWKGKPECDWRTAGPVRVPIKGGELFVSADSTSPAARGLQADLNAAANIGLRALNDPDWQGRWWYVPCDPMSFKPLPDKVAGSASMDPDKPLKDRAVDGVEETKKKRGKTKANSKEAVNLWRDGAVWKETTAYWHSVAMRVINDTLRPRAGLSADAKNS